MKERDLGWAMQAACERHHNESAEGSSGAGPSGHQAGQTSGAGAALTYGNFRGADLGVGAKLHGALAFPATNAWNTDISQAQIDPNSEALIASMGLNTRLHPDFGAGQWNHALIGIPYVVVAGSQAKVDVFFGGSKNQSDFGPYPIPANAPIEGHWDQDGERRVLVIDRDSNRLYEMANACAPASNHESQWHACAGAVFDLASNKVRPGGQAGWVSADAAGLPVFPGLVRHEEAANGFIGHALRFTASITRRAYVPPATHWDSSTTDANCPPMGMRVRLKASFHIPSTFSPESQAILQALKTYGMFLADQGANWFLSGAPDERWNNDKLLTELTRVQGADFEVVKMENMVFEP